MQLTDKIVVNALPVQRAMLPTVGVYEFLIPRPEALIYFAFFNPTTGYSITEQPEATDVETLLNAAFPPSTIALTNDQILITVPVPAHLPPVLQYQADGVGPFITVQGKFIRAIPVAGAVSKYFIESIWPFIPLVFRFQTQWAKTPTEGQRGPMTYSFHTGGNVTENLQGITFRDYDYNGAFAEIGNNLGSPFYHPVVPISDFRHFAADMRLREGLHYLSVNAEFAYSSNIAISAGGILAECIVVQFMP